MSETTPPYTGKSASGTKATPKAKAAAPKSKTGTPTPTPSVAVPPPAPAPPAPAPQAPPPPPPYASPAASAPVVTPAAPALPATAIWHSRAVLIGVAALAALTAIGTLVGAANFPNNAPVELAYAVGMFVDVGAVMVTLGVVTMVEFRRRANPARLALPVNRRPSVLAIVAIALAALSLAAWVIGDGPAQLIDLFQGLRARYMYHTGGLFVAGIPWALSLIFGALGFRPKGQTVTNALALVAIAISGLLALVALVAALVYGAGLSD